MWNIYVIGHIQSFFGVFTMLQMLFNPANNTAWASSGSVWGGPLIGLMLIISLIIIVVASFMQGRFLIHHIMIMAIAYAVLFGVTTQVNIENIYNGESQIVSGIPIGVAVPASIFSTVFWAVTKQLGQADDNVTTDNTNMFSGPSANNQVYGFDGPLALMYNLRGLYSTFSNVNPALNHSIVDYVDFCEAPDTSLLYTMGSQKDLATTLFATTPPKPNLTDTLYVNSSAVPVAHYNETCSEAASTLKSAWSTFETGTMPQGNENLGETIDTQLDNGSVSGLDASQASSLLDDVFMSTGNAGYDFMNNMILNCAVEAGANANFYWDSSSPTNQMSSYCSTKATAFGRSVTLNAANASLWEMNMIPMMAILQFLFFAGFPIIIVVALAMGPNGFGKIGAFMAFGATTLAWIPIAQIISNYAQGGMHATMQQLKNTLNGGHITASHNIPILLEHAMRQQAMADKMLALTPVVTMVLLGLGGAYAATRLAQDQSEESSAAQAIGETTPMEGTDTLSQGTVGVMQVSTGHAFAGNGAPEMMGTNPTLNATSVSLGSAATAGMQAANARVAEATQAYSVSSGKTATQLWNTLQTASTSEGSDFKDGTQATSKVSEMKQAVQSVASTLGVSDKKATQFLFGLNGAASADGATMGASWLNSADGHKAIAGAMKGIGVSMGVDSKQTATIAHELSKANTKSALNSVTSASAADLAHTIQTGTTDTALQSQAASLGKSAQQTEGLQRNLSAARKQQNSISKTASEIRNMGANTALNVGTMAGVMADHSNSQRDAVLESQALADNAGLGALWAQNYKKAKATGVSDYAAAASANIQTLRDSLSTGQGHGGEFMNGLLSKFGDGVLSSGAPSVTGQARSRFAAAGKMPAAGQSTENAVSGAVTSPNAGAAIGQFNSTKGAATRQVADFNPNQDLNRGAAKEFYADEELKDAKLPQAAINAYNKAHEAGKKNVDGSPLMWADHWMAKNPGLVDAGEGIATGLTAGVSGYAAYKAYQKAQLAKATGGGDAPASGGSDSAAGDGAATDAAALADEGGSVAAGEAAEFGPYGLMAYGAYKLVTNPVGNGDFYSGQQIAKLGKQESAPKPKNSDDENSGQN